MSSGSAPVRSFHSNQENTAREGDASPPHGAPPIIPRTSRQYEGFRGRISHGAEGRQSLGVLLYFFFCSFF